ncbi:Amidase 1 [Colletotrichum viniferum]|nr:Amidase 1 [Colletotrichum viniferum]
MWFVSALSLASLAVAAHAAQGRVIQINGVHYYPGGNPVGHLRIDLIRNATTTYADLLPMTVLELSDSALSEDELLNTIATYETSDDVFQPAFLQALYLRLNATGNRTVHGSGLSNSLQELGTSVLVSSSGLKGIASSVETGNISKAYRLYDDDSLAFVQGVISDEAGGFTSLPAVTENVMAKSTAVTSRLHYTATQEKPLAGLRFGVKDIFHVKGVATSGGNRAYFYLYGRQNQTAASVQRLIDLGAVLVGKMGTVQFANGDRPTADWVDLHAPFNPRGDGYQDPSGSSTGPGAGIAAYEWLDLAVGSDTGGSMRGPAGQQGIFGNRPSTGAISLEHVIPLSPVSDTAGMFARSGSLWAKVTQAWYPDFASDYSSYPKKIYRSTVEGGAWSGGSSEGAAKVIESFVGKLEQFLQVQSTPANYTQLWMETHNNLTTDVNEMLYLTCGVLVSHDQWQLHGQPFFEDYAARCDGRQPYINPGPLARWQ